jgi:hypothetical protein
MCTWEPASASGDRKVRSPVTNSLVYYCVLFLEKRIYIYKIVPNMVRISNQSSNLLNLAVLTLECLLPNNPISSS